jgi:hypothetical protein
MILVTVRWLSLEEFRAGEEQNPYAPEPAQRRRLSAVPESSYNFWLLGSLAYLGSMANRRRKAVSGEVWMPAGSARRRASRRRVVQSFLVIEVAALVFTALGSAVAPLVFTVLLIVTIPLTFFASRRASMRAWIDYRSGEVGVDDGLRPREAGARGTLTP